MSALCFVNGMGFTKDFLDREDTVEHHNGGPTVNAKSQMVLPLSKCQHRNLRRPSIATQNFFLSAATFSVDLGVCKKN